jgi:FkbM family methyltransferase
MFENLPNTFKTFYDSMLHQSIAALKLNRHFDNFDEARFNYDGVDRSKEFNTGLHAFYFDWFFNNSISLFNAYSLLNNEPSKRLFLHLIAYRLGGHLSVKIPVPFAGKDNELAEYKAFEKHTPSQLPASGMFGKLNHYDFEYKNQRYIAECLGFEHYLFRKQYFYSQNDLTIQPEIGDYVIDGGACTGDTALVFSNAIGESGRVYSFDPVKEHLDILAYNIAQFPNKNVQAMPFGLSNRDVIADPIVLGGYGPGFNSNNHKVPLRSIDSLVNTKDIEKIDFIKLDVEGAEMDTLRGAQQSIAHFKPKLAISLYHKPDDLFEIILYIKENFPFYNCYVDHYTIHSEETVLYCVANV